MLRVQNNFDDELVTIIYDTEEIWNSSGDQVEIRRKIGSQQVSWDIGTEHVIKIEGLTDLNGEDVWPYEYSFWTATRTQGTGNFQVVSLEPSETFITSQDYLYLTFSEPLIQNIAMCSTTQWANAIQLRVIESRSQVGQMGIPTLGNAEICLLCDRQGVCNMLRIRPLGGWPRPGGILTPSIIWMTVLDTLDLRSIHQETLGESMNYYDHVIVGGF